MTDLPTIVWKGVGAESRELSRKILLLRDQADSAERVKLLTAFLWTRWIRGYADHRNGVDRFWDFKV